MKLVIAEKPSVARSIANVIGAYNEQDGYLEGNGYYVTWCFGHIAGFEMPDSKWTLEGLPLIFSTTIRPLPDTIAHFKKIKGLMERSDVTSLVEATDAGREGEAIFRYTYKAAGCTKPFERLWISSMTDDAIADGFKNLRPGNEYNNLFNAAMARDFADKIIGLNGTRLFSLVYKQFKPPLSVGRVQTPTLAMICQRENEIENFVSTKYYKCHLIKEIDGKKLDAITKNIDNINEADAIVTRCNGKNATVTDVKVETKTKSAPKLYDLTTLQRECNRMFGYSAQTTLDTVQSLYEKKLCTYPRTDSSYLTDDMKESVRELITLVRYNVEFLEDVEPDYEIDKCINNKKVTDHHAIIPTDQITSLDWNILTDVQNNVLSLICTRLLSATARKMTYETTTIKLLCEDVEFKATGNIIIDGGFKIIEDLFKKNKKIQEKKEKKRTKDGKEEESEDEKELPRVAKGEILQNCECKKSEHNTKPPAHYTEDSILLAMERAGTEDYEEEVERMGLGTTATRAQILENLIQKDYLRREKKKLLPTQRAFKLMDSIPDVLKSPKITSDMENILAEVAKGQTKGSVFLDKINTMMNNIIADYKTKEITVDDNSFSAEDSALGKCPNCGGLVINGKNGAYCKEKCGMRLNMIFGKKLTDTQVRKLLKGEEIMMKGLKKKDGSGTYDMLFKPTGIEEMSYMNKAGEEVKGKQFVFERRFPQRKKSS